MTRYSMRDYDPSLTVILKARRYLSKGAVKAASGSYPPVFWVQGSARKPYRVQGDFKTHPSGRTTCSWVTCSCEWGRQQGAGASACSHAVAVLLAVKEGTQLPEIDRNTLALAFSDIPEEQTK